MTTRNAHNGGDNNNTRNTTAHFETLLDKFERNGESERERERAREREK